jgi:hypothetical protein
VLPIRHHGSVDIFFKAMEAANQGDVLVIDNGGRSDEEPRRKPSIANVIHTGRNR